MLLFANSLAGLAFALQNIIFFLYILVIVRVLISWVNPDPMNGLVRFVTAATDPLLIPIRRYVPSVGGLDFSPIILLILLGALDYALVRNPFDHAELLRRRSLA